MIDPDSPSLDDDTSVQVLHYLKTDFAVTDITNLGSSAATAAMPYAGADKSVGTGPHRYIFLLYDQPSSGFMNVGVPDPSNRTFSVATWKAANNLKPAIAGVHFVATPLSGAAPTSAVAEGAETTVWDYTITTTAPCTSTAMWSTSALVEPLITDSTLPYPTATAVASSAPPSAATTHKVIVGGPNTLTYQPSWVDASVGDVVEFDFLEKNHTVTQSTFDTPCIFNPAGVKSGFRPNPENIPGKETFTFNVTDTKPKWFYCAQAKHCQAGMVFAINPGTKFPAYLALATGGGSSAPAATATSIPSAVSSVPYAVSSVPYAVSSAPYAVSSAVVVSSALYPIPTTLLATATGTGGFPVATGNVSAPGATGVPIFEGAASGRVAASWVLAGVAAALVLL